MNNYGKKKQLIIKKLIPLNKEYKLFILEPEEDSFKVMGVLRKVIRK